MRDPSEFWLELEVKIKMKTSKVKEETRIHEENIRMHARTHGNLRSSGLHEFHRYSNEVKNYSQTAVWRYDSNT